MFVALRKHYRISCLTAGCKYREKLNSLVTTVETQNYIISSNIVGSDTIVHTYKNNTE